MKRYNGGAIGNKQYAIGKKATHKMKVNDKKEKSKNEKIELPGDDDETARLMAAIFDYEISAEEMRLWIVV